jgi:YD repeat-containing protein
MNRACDIQNVNEAFQKRGKGVTTSDEDVSGIETSSGSPEILPPYPIPTAIRRPSWSTTPKPSPFPGSPPITLGHRTIRPYDYRFGKVASVTDPNHVETTYEYDGFGRLRKVVESPDDVASSHGTVSYEYLDFGDPARQSPTVMEVRAGSPS